MAFGLEIIKRNSVGHSNEGIRITNGHGIGFDSSYTNEVNKKTTEGKHVLAVFRAHGFMYTIGDISIG